MSIQKIVSKQYRDKVNEAIEQFCNAPMRPKEGWLRTVRIALGMSGPQLARRLGVTKARVSRAEQAEPLDGVTLKTMRSMAEAMDCKFIYAVVPKKNVETIIKLRAIDKARAKVKIVSTHMALEAQALSKQQIDFEIERIAVEILQKLPSDFWDEI